MNKILQGLAAVFALTGMSATPQTTIQAQPTGQHQTKHNDAINRNIAITPVDELKELHGSGTYLDERGLSPKEYGQMLQASGRQKWVKSRKHTRR